MWISYSRKVYNYPFKQFLGIQMDIVLKFLTATSQIGENNCRNFFFSCKYVFTLIFQSGKLIDSYI